MSGFGTELGIANIIFLLGLVFKLFIMPWYQTKKELKKAERNPGHKIETQKFNINNMKIPGYSKICLEHREKLTEIGIQLNNLDGDLEKSDKKNDRAHEQIWQRLNEIRDKI